MGDFLESPSNIHHAVHQLTGYMTDQLKRIKEAATTTPTDYAAALDELRDVLESFQAVWKCVRMVMPVEPEPMKIRGQNILFLLIDNLVEVVEGALMAIARIRVLDPADTSVLRITTTQWLKALERYPTYLAAYWHAMSCVWTGMQSENHWALTARAVAEEPE